MSRDAVPPGDHSSSECTGALGDRQAIRLHPPLATPPPPPLLCPPLKLAPCLRVCRPGAEAHHGGAVLPGSAAAAGRLCEPMKPGTCSGALLLPWPLCPGQGALQLAPSLAACQPCNVQVGIGNMGAAMATRLLGAGEPGVGGRPYGVQHQSIVARVSCPFQPHTPRAIAGMPPQGPSHARLPAANSLPSWLPYRLPADCVRWVWRATV